MIPTMPPTLTAEQKLVVRLWVCDRGNHPVSLADDPDQEPTLAGAGSYYATPGGRRIQYPNAYKWPKTYHASTRHLTVGARWLLAHPITRRRIGGLTMWGLSAEVEYVHGLRITRGWYQGRQITLVEGEWSYHAPGWDARKAVRAALHGWHRQRLADRAAAVAQRHAATIWVTAADSLAAGNCPIGTESVVRELSRALGAGDSEIGAVRADYLLAHRNDTYTQRAVRAAKQRQAQDDEGRKIMALIERVAMQQARQRGQS